MRIRTECVPKDCQKLIFNIGCLNENLALDIFMVLAAM